jgi:hypothetical protein
MSRSRVRIPFPAPNLLTSDFAQYTSATRPSFVSTALTQLLIDERQRRVGVPFLTVRYRHFEDTRIGAPGEHYGARALFRSARRRRTPNGSSGTRDTTQLPSAAA